MRPPALALSDEQLGLVWGAAAALPVGWRERFLRALADQLIDCEVTNASVQRAINVVLRGMQVIA
jgi:hypothetical protein